MVTIAKEYDFDAAHKLPNVPDGHKCKRMHGHTYRVELVFAGEMDERGFVADYAEIDALWQPIHERLDHRVLNDIPGLENPTTEMLAWWISSLVPHPLLVRVRVSESSSTWAEVQNR